ncbi:MAG: C40 family peptidase [Peptoanaerobacter stomatis]|uniref:C40 family peptidase n=1 Tax=Peptoanaerobacter stomatis TaxID=796937 RepID=UPI003FA00648
MKTRADILKYAKSLIGFTNYKMGAKYYNYNNDMNKPKLLDCSGFVVWCYKMAGFKVADGTYMQWQTSEEVNYKELKVGDIGIKESGGIGMYNHIGIYVGNGQWIHCNYSRNGVTLEKTNIFKYYRRFNNIEFEDDKLTKPSSKIKDDTQTKKDDKTSTIKPNSNKKKEDDEMIEKKEFIVNNKKVKLETIFKDDKNYVSLQSLKDANVLDASYDKVKKIAVITSK